MLGHNVTVRTTRARGRSDEASQEVVPVSVPPSTLLDVAPLVWSRSSRVLEGVAS